MGSRWGRGQRTWSHHQKVHREIRTKSLTDVLMAIKHISNDYKFFKTLTLLPLVSSVSNQQQTEFQERHISEVKLNCEYWAAPGEVRYDPVKWMEPDDLQLLERQQMFLHNMRCEVSNVLGQLCLTTWLIRTSNWAPRLWETSWRWNWVEAQSSNKTAWKCFPTKKRLRRWTDHFSTKCCCWLTYCRAGRPEL